MLRIQVGPCGLTVGLRFGKFPWLIDQKYIYLLTAKLDDIEHCKSKSSQLSDHESLLVFASDLSYSSFDEVYGISLRVDNLPFDHLPFCLCHHHQWWRVCLDEAQMIENTMTKTAEMALRLSAVNRW